MKRNEWVGKFNKMIIYEEKENMKLYWVSLLIQDKENTKPWLCVMSGLKIIRCK